jgi:hypothetical protein
MILAGCGGTIERSKPRMVISCPAAHEQPSMPKCPAQPYAVDSDIVVHTSWSGTCSNPRIGVEGAGREDRQESCNEQAYDAKVQCAGVRCDVERAQGREVFKVTPRDAGKLELVVKFEPLPSGSHRTLREQLTVVKPERLVVACNVAGALANPTVPDQSFVLYAYLATAQTPLISNPIRVEQLEVSQDCATVGNIGADGVIQGFICTGDTATLRASLGAYTSSATVRRRGSSCDVTR